MEKILAKIGEMARGGVIPLEALQSVIDEYDPIVVVDRSVIPVYPDWVKERLYPELEKTGPDTLDASKLELWLHPKQVNGVAEGNEIHDFLKKNNLLSGCLGLADLLAIQKRGVVFFRKHFAGKVVFGWQSVVRNRYGDLNVPCLLDLEGGVIVYWRWLGYHWFSFIPALRLASQSSDI
jgi:hypothetical protein